MEQQAPKDTRRWPLTTDIGEQPRPILPANSRTAYARWWVKLVPSLCSDALAGQAQEATSQNKPPEHPVDQTTAPPTYIHSSPHIPQRCPTIGDHRAFQSLLQAPAELYTQILPPFLTAVTHSQKRAALAVSLYRSRGAELNLGSNWCEKVWIFALYWILQHLKIPIFPFKPQKMNSY